MPAYQHGHNAHFRGFNFKLATSKFVLSIIDGHFMHCILVSAQLLLNSLLRIEQNVICHSFSTQSFSRVQPSFILCFYNLALNAEVKRCTHEL